MPISQRNCQIKFKFGSKEAIITKLKSSSLKTPCSELRLTQSWCIQDPGEIDKNMFKQSEEIDPLIYKFNNFYNWSVMRGKTIYTKPILSVLWSVMRRRKKNWKKKRDKCMQCYEGKDKFIQKSILNALWSVMRGTTWTLQCIKML